MYEVGFPGGSGVKNLPDDARDTGSIFPAMKNPLEEEMTTRSSILMPKIPWTEEPGGLQSTESQKVSYD